MSPSDPIPPDPGSPRPAPPPPAGGKIVAVDYGSRRMGLAMADPILRLALPWRTIDATGRGPAADAERLREEIQQAGERVARFIVGLPLNMDGTAGPQARLTREFGEQLRRRSGVPVEFCDERLSSFAAEDRVRPAAQPPSRRLGKSARPRSRPLDSLAATVILEDYLRRGG